MVSNPPTPEPASEITISLDGGPEPERPPPRLRISNAALAFTTILLLLAAGAVTIAKWLPVGERTAEAAVRSFLEAVRAGDVDEALALAGEEFGNDEFLVPEALDDRWAVTEIAQVAYEDSPQGPEAQVYAEIEAYDGTRLGHRYRVRLDDGGPVVLDGLGRTARGMDSGFIALELNGHIPEPGGHSSLLILPGVYVPYESQPETLDLGVRTFLTLGDQFIELGAEKATNGFPGGWPELSETGQEALDRSVKAYLDDCAERAPVEGCPFATPPEDDRIAVPAGAAWEITAYPQVSGSYVYPSQAEGHGFDLLTTEPGSIEVDAVVTAADGTERQTRLSCGIWVEDVDAVFDTGGGVALTWDRSAPGACDAMIEVD